MHSIYDAQMGNYMVRFDSNIRHIYPVGKNGKSMRITLIKHTIAVKHVHDTEEILFTRYKHQSRWYFRDSRNEKSITRNHIVNELTRMLRITSPEASALVSQHLSA